MNSYTFIIQSLTVRKSYKSHTGLLPKFQNISTTPITDDCPNQDVNARYKTPVVPTAQTSNVTKNGRRKISGTKDVVYDVNGNVSNVQKINIASLPQHRFVFSLHSLKHLFINK